MLQPDKAAAPSIGIVLSAYKRTHLLADQLQAIRRQSVPATEVLIWHNPDDSQGVWSHFVDDGEHIVSTSLNRGVWGRFAILQLLNTDFIHVIDDDTMPGHDWLLNCIETFDGLPEHSVLGTCGRVFPDGTRQSAAPVGWQNPMDATVHADVLNHSWFFKRVLAEKFTATYQYGLTCGEDYAICVLARKYGGVVACPPHPPNDLAKWGSLRGMELGADEHALYLQGGEESKKNAVHDDLRSRGWKVAAEVFRG